MGNQNKSIVKQPIPTLLTINYQLSTESTRSAPC